MPLEKIIRLLKKDPNYKWDSKYATRDLLIIALRRSEQILRGFFTKPFLKSTSGLLFRGRAVTLLHRYQISAGKNLILEDNVFINALSYKGIHLGGQVSIGKDSILFCTGIISQKGEGISIGDRTGINARAYFAGQGGITIGSDVIMGPGVHIFSENHNFTDPEIPIKEQGVTRAATTIGNNCWLGANCQILAGVTVGDGCVIAAGSIVTKSIPANSVAAGVPARIIKHRTTA